MSKQTSLSRKVASGQHSLSDADLTFIAFDGLKGQGVPYSRVHLGRLMAQNQFPRPIMLSPNRRAWKLSDIVAWKVSRVQAGRNK